MENIINTNVHNIYFVYIDSFFVLSIFNKEIFSNDIFIYIVNFFLLGLALIGFFLFIIGQKYKNKHFINFKEFL